MVQRELPNANSRPFLPSLYHHPAVSWKRLLTCRLRLGENRRFGFLLSVSVNGCPSVSPANKRPYSIRSIGIGPLLRSQPNPFAFRWLINYSIDTIQKKQQINSCHLTHYHNVTGFYCFNLFSLLYWYYHMNSLFRNSPFCISYLAKHSMGFYSLESHHPKRIHHLNNYQINLFLFFSYF